jgi:hypothetical protein
MAGFRAALRPGGKAAFSQLCWLGDARPAAAAAFWAEEYPQMTDVAGVHAEIAAAGAQIIAATTLGPAGWAAYYDPLEARLDVLEPGATGDLAAQVMAHRREIAVWREHGDSFGYRLFLVRP